MSPLDAILIVLVFGLASLALAGWAAARRWKRAYQDSLGQFRLLLVAVQGSKRAKSEPHVRAAKTRAERAIARMAEHRHQLEADIHARELGW